MSTNRRGSFIGWTPPHKYQDTASYYERVAEKNYARSSHRRASTEIAGGWEEVLHHGMVLPAQEQQHLAQNSWSDTRGEYGAGRTRMSRKSPTGPRQHPSPTKESITINCERSKDGTALPTRVISDGPTAYKSIVVAPNASLEYQTSDLFGYYASHELDWAHIISNGDEHQRTVEDQKMKRLLTSLHLTHLISIFMKHNISYTGIRNMTYQHFNILGIVGDDQVKLSKALLFVKHIARSKATSPNMHESNKTAAATATNVERMDHPEDILSIQRHRPRYMVSSRKWRDHYKGPAWGQNITEFHGGMKNIKTGHGDAITGMFWASTLRAKKNGHHHSNDFTKNYIRHEGVTLHSSHIDPRQLISSPPPKRKHKVPEAHQGNGRFEYDRPGRRGTVHMMNMDAPWANVQGLQGNFRK